MLAKGFQPGQETLMISIHKRCRKLQGLLVYVFEVPKCTLYKILSCTLPINKDSCQACYVKSLNIEYRNVHPKILRGLFLLYT